MIKNYIAGPAHHLFGSEDKHMCEKNDLKRLNLGIMHYGTWQQDNERF